MIKLGPFTAAEERALRKAGGSTCLIDGEIDRPQINTLAALRVLINVLDGDGNQTGRTRIARRTVQLTITDVTGSLPLDEYTAEQVEILRRTYPNAAMARLITFKVGDWRDLDRYLARGGGTVTDATRSIDRDAPLPPDGFVQDLADRARQRDDARRARERSREIARSLAIRLKDAEKRTDPDELARIRTELESMEVAMRSTTF